MSRQDSEQANRLYDRTVDISRFNNYAHDMLRFSGRGLLEVHLNQEIEPFLFNQAGGSQFYTYTPQALIPDIDYYNGELPLLEQPSVYKPPPYR